MADEPSPEPEAIERWAAQRKAAIIVEVMKGQISVSEAARKHGFTHGEYRKWADEYHQAGVEALKVNRKDQEAKHQAEIRRLRAKIDQLVMNDEIRQEATRPFLSGDQTSSVWSPKAKDRVRDSADS